MFLIALVRAGTALAFLLSQKGLTYLSPSYFVGLRLILAGILILAGVYYWQPTAFKWHRRDLGSFSKVIFFQMYLAFMAEFWALQYLSAPKVALLFNLIPFFTALLAYFMLRERLLKQQIAGLIIGFLGFLAAFNGNSTDAVLPGSPFTLPLPEIAILLAAMSTSYAWLTVQKLIVQRSYTPFFINGFTMLGGGLLALLTAVLIEPLPSLTGDQWATTAVWLGLLIMLSNLLCYPLYGWLLRRYSATFLALTSLTMPLFAALWEWIFFGRCMPTRFYLALSIIATGLILFYLGESKRLARLTEQASEHGA